MSATRGDCHKVRVGRRHVARAVDTCTEAGPPRMVRRELWPGAATAGQGLRSEGKEWRSVRFAEREDFASFAPLRYSDAIATVTGRWLDRDPETLVVGEEVANFGGGAWEWDEKMSRFRKDRNWAEQIRLAMDPDLAREIRGKTCREDHETCTMCGDLCAYKADSGL